MLRRIWLPEKPSVSPFRKGITKISSPLGVPDLQAESSKNDSSTFVEEAFWGVEKLSFLAIPGESELDYWSWVWHCILSFLLMVEFQWFLMELSVLPGNNLAIIAHLLPYLNWLSHTVCEPAQSLHLPCQSTDPCLCQGSGDYATSPCTACLSFQEAALRCSSSFLHRSLWPTVIPSRLITSSESGFKYPGSLDQVWIKNFLPAMQALHVSTVLQEWSYLFPVFCTELLDKLLQFFVLLRCPPVLLGQSWR